jgi:hypothetical protein
MGRFQVLGIGCELIDTAHLQFTHSNHLTYRIYSTHSTYLTPLHS